MITITINEKKITLEKPVTILEAARSAGIHIPTLCHEDILEPYGGCRLCLVEVEKVPRLLSACTQYITEGMVVRTETERVIEARRAILEFLLINHPLDCSFCDKAGECDLQDLAMKYGPATGRFAEGKRKHPESYDDPLIVRNMERCVLCSKCVRMCEDVQGASALCITNRGSKSYVEPFSGGRYNCEYCGNCLTVCPVGAIMSGLHRHDYRSWLIEREVETVCSYCGVGCSLLLQIRGNSLIRTVPKIGRGLNRGLLCSKGRFGYDYISNSERLDTPLIRRNGELQPAAWSEAITHIARRLKEIKENHGSDAIAGIVSGRCTNEDAYVFQKFFRGAIGTNNIDSVASLAYGPAQRFFERIFGQGVTANDIHGISNSDGIFVIGGDPTGINPVLGLQVRSACKKGAPVVVMGYAEGLKRFSKHAFITNSTTETVLLASLVSEIKKKKSLPGERPVFEEIISGLQPVPLKDASEMSGFGLNDLVDTVDTLSNMINPSIIVGRDIVQTSTGHMSLLFLAALAYLLNGRIYLLSELPNEQGLLDMGCQPDMLPSGRPLTIETFRTRCEETLGIAIPSTPGLNYVEMIEAAHAGRIKALYVMGEDTVQGLPDRNYVSDALRNVEFLVVQDMFLTETAQYADVVLPSLSWAEKEGSYTNLERRVQLTKKAVEGEGIEEWKIISEMSKILGLDMGYRSVTDIFTEIVRISHIYREITYNDITSGRCMWPYKGGPLRHDVHIEGIELPDIVSVMKNADESGVQVRREAHLFHSQNASRYSPALQSISPEPYVKMSETLAGRLSLRDGEHVKVVTEAGSITLSVHRDPCLPENVVLIPPFEKGGIFEITKWKVNPVTKAPALDGNRVIIET
ncbi:MAG: molybdopterin-dependent oxidoreductase [Nitrospirae bacterium]|nr:molybdopterin-dependent oxidoreductase [Nitrospirota bacterium]MCL5421301.1 molybdopterin-dependent oxidoreductase [Nitrospirota bacterium]